MNSNPQTINCNRCRKSRKCDTVCPGCPLSAGSALLDRVGFPGPRGTPRYHTFVTVYLLTVYLLTVYLLTVYLLTVYLLTVYLLTVYLLTVYLCSLTPSRRYQDVLFVMEEIDTDPKGICMNRATKETPTKKEDEDEANKEEDQKAKQNNNNGQWNQNKGNHKWNNKANDNKSAANKSSAPELDLGDVLRALDGNS